MRVDVHCHVGQLLRPMRPEPRFAFEQNPWEAFISPPLIRRIPRPLLRWATGVDLATSETEINDAIERFLLRHILSAGAVDRIVILAFDAYHTDGGEAVGPARSLSAHGTHLYVSNTYARSFCDRHPDRLLFGASVHPYRHDALAALDAVAAAGAVLVKWLPPVHNIDAIDPRTVEFLAHAGRLGMPLLIHGGGEMTLPSPRPDFADVRRWLEALRLVRGKGPMPPVMIAHAGTPSFQPFGRCAYFDAFVEALRDDFADAPLYAEVAALTTPFRARWLQFFLDRPKLHSKLVHGSDFPVYTLPLLFRHRVGRRWRSIMACESWLDRDVQLKEALGLPESVFTRFGETAARRIAHSQQ